MFIFFDTLWEISNKLSEGDYPAINYFTDYHLYLANDGKNVYNTLSHILFVFECHIYILREKQYSIYILITNLLKIRKET